MNRRTALSALLAGLSLLLVACAAPPKPNEIETRIQVVATTGMLGDTISEIGGDLVRVDTLMGPGLDPHQYSATEGDVRKITEADLIVYNGLHLEAQMAQVFEKMSSSGKTTLEATKDIPRDKLIKLDEAGTNYDPHVWMDVALWTEVSRTITKALIEQRPDKEETLRTNLEYYEGKLRMLDQNIRIAVESIPEERRVLITAHDAFAYYGRAYGIDVRGLQGVSTASEAGARDVQELANLIVEKKIPAIFVETSVPRRHVEALQEAVKAKGHQVRIGRPLYSDSIGDYGTALASYVGMMRFNAGIIADELGLTEDEKKAQANQ